MSGEPIANLGPGGSRNRALLPGRSLPRRRGRERSGSGGCLVSALRERKTPALRQIVQVPGWHWEPDEVRQGLDKMSQFSSEVQGSRPRWYDVDKMSHFRHPG